jgi:eukaryotic-like serine/threonine-protein kinase
VALSAGTRLGPYEILSTLGSGGMGVVYRARDNRLGREVAIKVLPTEVAGDHDRLHRFEKEARAVSALNHPNIVDVHDIGTHQGLPFIVCELLEGETLRRLLSAGPIPIPRALEYATQVATGLAAAHDKGIVHRDLKPENVFVTEDERVKILDFGLAKVTKPESEGASGSESVTETVGTKGMVLGTVAYMSPEQIRGLPADRRSDVFSFGVMLYELLVGTRPFKADTPVDTMTAILTKDPFETPPASARVVPPVIARVVRHCLEKKPEERFQSARDVLFALETFSDLSEAPASVRRKPKPWMVVAALAGVALTLLTLYGAGVLVGRRSAASPAPVHMFS